MAYIALQANVLFEAEAYFQIFSKFKIYGSIQTRNQLM